MVFARGTPAGPGDRLPDGIEDAPRQVRFGLTSSRITIIDVDYPGRHEFPTHTHGAAYLTLVVRGAYEEWSPRRRRRRAGDVVEYAAGSRHAVRTGMGAPRILHVAIDDGVFDRGPLTAGWLWQIAREAREVGDDARLCVECMGLELVDSRSHAASPARPAWLDRVLDRLRDEPEATCTLEDLARSEGLHPAGLARAFRRHTGMTAGTFLRRVRLARATRLLATTHAPIAQIAIAAGFADQSHMGRLFRRHLGTTPRAFRTGLATS